MLTIVLPTHNRPNFALRALRYYARLELAFQVIVLDSSAFDKYIPTSAIESLKASGLYLDYRAYPEDTPFAEKTLHGLKDVKTKYVVLGADDDFFIPRALTDSIDFLESHPEYDIYHGEAVGFCLEGDHQIQGNITQIANYHQRGLEQASGVGRLLDSMADYSTTWYSVHRTHFLFDNFKKISELTEDYLLFELALSNMDAIQGKARKADALYMVRQGIVKHSANYRNYNAPPYVFDWITSPQWGSTFDRIRDYLAGQLAEHDGIERQEALLVVRDAYFGYLSHYAVKSPLLSKAAVQRQGENFTSRKTPRYAHEIKARIKLWRNQLHKRLRRFTDDKTLDHLLDPKSKYHKDFMPVYHAVTDIIPNEATMGEDNLHVSK